MKTYHLSFDDSEDNFQIFAIYTDEQDYRMAFLLNKYLKLQLIKSPSIIDKNKKTDFSIFEYEDTTLINSWFLLSNHCLVNSNTFKTKELDLFDNNPAIFQQKKFYFNKFKKAKFLLKIITDEDMVYYEKTLKRLKQIPQIYEVELIDLKRIKNKKLLIF